MATKPHIVYQAKARKHGYPSETVLYLDKYSRLYWSIELVADYMGVAHRTICRRLRVCGIKVRSQGGHTDYDGLSRGKGYLNEEQMYISLIAEGCSQVQIAEMTGKTAPMIGRRLKVYGLSTGQKGGRKTTIEKDFVPVWHENPKHSNLCKKCKNPCWPNWSICRRCNNNRADIRSEFEFDVGSVPRGLGV